jgi:hypothetical protein
MEHMSGGGAGVFGPLDLPKSFVLRGLPKRSGRPAPLGRPHNSTTAYSLICKLYKQYVFFMMKADYNKARRKMKRCHDHGTESLTEEEMGNKRKRM